MAVIPLNLFAPEKHVDVQKAFQELEAAKCTSTVLASESFWTAGHRKGTSDVFNWKIFRASMFLDEICVYKNVTEAKNWAPGEPNNLGDEGCVEFCRWRQIHVQRPSLFLEQLPSLPTFVNSKELFFKIQ
ncbi:hypothetical protein HELRODRAFT_159477 [Helobdella robusta]|uniref:Uncharacterized protein n=1 Tax=Helobdella robusta TaxID=6412 RepID=T1EP28_HELRO|nr:hypothetical protein HELRODRAFT_159477 [Helobdella robusta]ESO12891.1 hypothetical protein HELRODRAFT_159477 [Helobdella robusta]